MQIPNWILSYLKEQRNEVAQKELEYKAVKKNHKLMYGKVKWFDGLRKTK